MFYSATVSCHIWRGIVVMRKKLHKTLTNPAQVLCFLQKKKSCSYALVTTHCRPATDARDRLSKKARPFSHKPQNTETFNR